MWVELCVIEKRPSINSTIGGNSPSETPVSWRREPKDMTGLGGIGADSRENALLPG